MTQAQARPDQVDRHHRRPGGRLRARRHHPRGGAARRHPHPHAVLRAAPAGHGRLPHVHRRGRGRPQDGARAAPPRSPTAWSCAPTPSRCAPCATCTSSCCSATTTRSARRPAATPAPRTSRSRSSWTTSRTATTRTACASCARTCRSRPCSGASARGPARVPAGASSWSTHHHLPAAPLHGRPDHRRGADGRAAAAGRAQGRTPASASPSSAAGPPASPPPSTRGSRATRVKIFEALPKPGGMLRYGIPSYRLPRDVIDKEINVLWRMGVELQCNSAPGRRLPARGPARRGLRRRVPRPRRLQRQRDGHPRRGRRGRGHGHRLPGRARAHRRRARGRQGRRHRRRLHRHGRLPHQRAQGRRRGHLPLPPLAQGDAGAPHRGRRGRGRGRQARAAVRAGARGHRRAQQGHRHRDAAHGARRAGRLRAPPPGARRGLRVRRRVRPGDHRHRPVPQARRHQRGAGREAHQVAHHRRRRLDLPDRRPARVRRRRRRARRADRHPGRRPGQEGRLEHGRLPARRRHGRRCPSRSPSSRRSRSSTRSSAKTDLDPRIARMAEIAAGVHRHDHRRDASRARRPRCPSCAPEERADQLQADRARLQRGRGRARRRAVPGLLLPGQRQVRPAALRHRVRGLQEPLPRRRGPRLPGRLPPRLHHARAQPLHQLRPLRARLPHGGRRELLRHHGPRLRHHRVSTADNLPLQMVGCVSCGKCAETCPTGAIETNPRLLESYDLDESRCIFCGECVEVCPYDALEQNEFFELAGYDRSEAGRRAPVRARAAPGRPAARDRPRPRAARAGLDARPGLGVGAHQGRPSALDEQEERG